MRQPAASQKLARSQALKFSRSDSCIGGTMDEKVVAATAARQLPKPCILTSSFIAPSSIQGPLRGRSPLFCRAKMDALFWSLGRSECLMVSVSLKPSRPHGRSDELSRRHRRITISPPIPGHGDAREHAVQNHVRVRCCVSKSRYGTHLKYSHRSHPNHGAYEKSDQSFWPVEASY